MYYLLSEERKEDPEKILTARDVSWAGLYAYEVGQKKPVPDPMQISPFSAAHGRRDLYVSGAATAIDAVADVEGYGPGFCPACKSRSCRGRGHCDAWDKLMDSWGKPLEVGDWYKSWGPYDTMVSPMNTKIANCNRQYAPCSIQSIVKDWKELQGGYPLAKKNVKSIDSRYVCIENNSRNNAIDVGIGLDAVNPPPVVFRIEPGRKKDCGMNTYDMPPQYIWLYDIDTGKLRNFPPHVVKYPINSISLNEGTNLWFCKNFHIFA